MGRKLIRKALAPLFVAALAGACGRSGGGAASTGTEKYFGYVGVDCGTDYTSEVQAFTNFGHMCVYEPDDVSTRLEAFRAAGMKALLDLHFIFFEEGGAPGGSGTGYDLRADYLQRWADFLAANEGHLTASYIAAIYPAEEPTWLGISPSELQTVATLVKQDLPDLPMLLIEAHQGLDDLVIPTEYDWVGMDFYGAIDPRNGAEFSAFAWLNTQFVNYFAELKSLRSRADQKLLIVFDAQWSPTYDAVGYSQSSLADFVRNYYLFMLAEPDAIGLFGYVYFSGLDGPDWIGLRDLPQAVLDANREVGLNITGK